MRRVYSYNVPQQWENANIDFATRLQYDIAVLHFEKSPNLTPIRPENEYVFATMDTQSVRASDTKIFLLFFCLFRNDVQQILEFLVMVRNLLKRILRKN